MTGLSYALTATVVVLVGSVVWYWTDLKNSCEMQSEGVLPAAVAANNTPCVEYRLSQGTPPPSVFTGGHPLLHVAAEKSDPNILDLLLHSGHFDPNRPTVDGETPLHAAVRRGHPDLVCHLIMHGALSRIPNRDFITPLDLARELPEQDIAAMLENSGCLPAP